MHLNASASGEKKELQWLMPARLLREAQGQ
jgi:hypothetical protein